MLTLKWIFIYVKNQWYTTTWIYDAKRQFYVSAAGTKFSFTTAVYIKHIAAVLKFKKSINLTSVATTRYFNNLSYYNCNLACAVNFGMCRIREKPV